MASTNLGLERGSYSAEMDHVERASRDEIMALQTGRLAWSLAQPGLFCIALDRV